MRDLGPDLLTKVSTCFTEALIIRPYLFLRCPKIHLGHVTEVVNCPIELQIQQKCNFTKLENYPPPFSIEVDFGPYEVSWANHQLCQVH